MNYLARRIVRAFLLLVAVSALCFLFTEMAPGSFFDEMRLNPQISPETIASLRAQYGLDQPLIVRYGNWLKSAAHGDFGYSIAYNVPVAPLLWSRATNTLLLTSIAMLLTWLVSIPLGVWSATKPGQFFDKSISAAGSLLISIPEVVMAVALLAIAIHWQLLPAPSSAVGIDVMPFWMRIQNTFSRMLLPILILILVEAPIIIRHIRASVAEALESPFVQSARSFGIGRTRLLFRHVLPVAANPVISLLGFSLAGLISGSLVVEVVCGWPGLGPLILEATLARDLYLVIGGLMFAALFMIAGTLAADLLLLVSDPRIRTGAPDAG